MPAIKFFSCLLFLPLLALSFTLPNNAFALSLDQAKSQGLVGETPTGYLEAVNPGSSPQIQALITDINSRRKAEYTAIAKKNGTEIRAVEALAGQKAIDQTGAGRFVKVGGQWVKK